MPSAPPETPARRSFLPRDDMAFVERGRRRSDRVSLLFDGQFDLGRDHGGVLPRRGSMEETRDEVRARPGGPARASGAPCCLPILPCSAVMVATAVAGTPMDGWPHARRGGRARGRALLCELRGIAAAVGSMPTAVLAAAAAPGRVLFALIPDVARERHRRVVAGTALGAAVSSYGRRGGSRSELLFWAGVVDPWQM